MFGGHGGFGGIASGRAPDGGQNESGASILAAPGAGGDGGTALLEYGSAKRHFGHAGQGGEPGSAFLTAGNGGPPNCDGGGSEARMANSGAPGDGSLPSPDPVLRGAVAVTGGNGYAGPATSGDGGNGTRRRRSRSARTPGRRYLR